MGRAGIAGKQAASTARGVCTLGLGTTVLKHLYYFYFILFDHNRFCSQASNNFVQAGANCFSFSAFSF